MLKLQDLTVSIADKTILKDVSFSFEKGKIYAIMGPNGSGKSTLAASIMGHPAYSLSKKSKILFQGKEIQEEEAYKRAKKGIFLSFQSPLTLAGVTVFQLMRVALEGKMDPLDLKNKLKEYAKELKIKEELLTRPLNEGFSGGEKKKMEILQAAVMNPSFLILDEIDTGVDIDSLKTIAQFLVKLKQQDRTIVIITHYNRILKHLEPDNVLIIMNGEIAQQGDSTLALDIETKGYGWIAGSK